MIHVVNIGYPNSKEGAVSTVSLPNGTTRTLILRGLVPGEQYKGRYSTMNGGVYQFLFTPPHLSLRGSSSMTPSWEGVMRDGYTSAGQIPGQYPSC